MSFKYSYDASNNTGTVLPVVPDASAMEAERVAYEASPEYKLSQIQSLKEQLATSDYKAIKFAEGWISEEDYAPIRAQRQALRDEINRLEETL